MARRYSWYCPAAQCVIPQWTGGNIMIGGGGGVLPYPTVANSTLWIDRFNSNTTTPGASVSSIILPASWGASLGAGVLSQATGSKQPLFQTDGLQCNGSSTILPLPQRISVTGDYTYYFVTKRGANGTASITLGVNANSFYDSIGQDSSDDSGCYVIDSAINVAIVGASDNTYCIRRIRRASGVTYYKRPGVAEASTSNAPGTINLDNFLARIETNGNNTFTSAGCRICQVVLVARNILPDSPDDLAIIAKLQALESGVAGP